jgi:hypothetical protein
MSLAAVKVMPAQMYDAGSVLSLPPLCAEAGRGADASIGCPA